MEQNTQKSKVRNSSIELLRIIAMLMIVFHHFAVHGGFEWGRAISINRLWYNFIIMGGKIGVNVFVIISGYYLINDDIKSVGLEKIIKFLGQAFFYSIAIFIIGKLTGVSNLGVKSLVKACLPITFSEWWFASTYFVLYLMHPFLNKLLHSLDQSSYQRFILILVVCWSLIPTFTTSSFQSNPLLWFITLYSISGYIRLYGLNHKFTVKHYFVFCIICSVFTYFSSVVFAVLGTRWDVFASYTTYFYGQEKITVVCISLGLFMSFISLNMNYHKWINVLASAAFGVYLIHDHTIIRRFLWIELFENVRYQKSLFLIPYSILVVAAVYMVCTLIDLLRQHFIEKPFMSLIQRCLKRRS